MEQNQGISIGWLCEKISSFPFEQTYTKPKKWLWAAMLSAAVLLGGATVGLVQHYTIQNKLNTLHEQIDALSKKEDVPEVPEKQPGIGVVSVPMQPSEQVPKQEVTRLEQEIAKLSDSFEEYKKSHPAEVSEEQLSALVEADRNFQNLSKEYSALLLKQRELEKSFTDYKETHPEALTLMAYADLEKKLSDANESLESLQKEFSDYKKGHTRANEEYAALEKRCATLKEEKDSLLKNNVELLAKLGNIAKQGLENCHVYRDKKTNDLYVYFDVTYDTSLPSESLVKSAGDWVGPKRVGRYITPEIDDKFDALDIITAGLKEHETKKGDVDNISSVVDKVMMTRCWIRLEEKGHVGKYFLVIEYQSGKSSSYEIPYENVRKFVQAVLEKR